MKAFSKQREYAFRSIERTEADHGAGTFSTNTRRRNEMRTKQSFAVNRRRMTPSDIVLYMLMILTGIVTLYPFLNVAALSFNDAVDSVKEIGRAHV